MKDKQILKTIGLIEEPLRGTVEMNDEGSLSSEVGGGKVIAEYGPLTMEFDEAHLEEGRGNSRSYEGWGSLYGDSENGAGSAVASQVS